MNAALSQVHEALARLHTAVGSNEGITDNLTSYGAHVLPIGRAALQRFIEQLMGQIGTAPDIALTTELVTEIPAILKELEVATTTLLPQVGSANAGYAAPALVSLLLSIAYRLRPSFAWSEVSRDEKIPESLSRRARKLETALGQLDREIQELAKTQKGAEEVLARVAKAIEATHTLEAELDRLNSETKASAEAAKTAAGDAAGQLAEVAAIGKKAGEQGTIVTHLTEKATADGTEIGEIAKRVTAYDGQVKANAESITQALQRVTAAADEGAKAREKLATDLADVTKHASEVEKQRNQVAGQSTEVDKALTNASAAQKEAEEQRDLAGEHAARAAAWEGKANDAYRIVTTAGLAGAFHQRAKQLTDQSYLWLFALGAALFVAAAIGLERSKEISDLLRHGKNDPIVVLIQVILSVFTVGAPVWMAWLATKQVAHSFRLAEDYGYKASVAKAYEGFKVEAAKLQDDQFEARLFSAALERLSENPLRLLSETQPGSPIQEFLQHPAMQELMKTVPTAKEHIFAALKGIITKRVPGAEKAAEAVAKEATEGKPTEKA